MSLELLAYWTNNLIFDRKLENPKWSIINIPHNQDEI